MALTSMLVMYTLNNSISAKLPATAYMKMIDIWLLFGLLLPFVIILLLILMEHLPENNVAPIRVTPAPVKKMEALQKKQKPFYPSFLMSKSAVTSFARYTLPVLEICFVILYSVAAVIIYFFQ